MFIKHFRRAFGLGFDGVGAVVGWGRQCDGGVGWMVLLHKTDGNQIYC